MLNGGADWIRELAEHSSPSDGTRMSPIAWMGVTEKRGFRRSLSGSLDEWKSTQPRRLDISSGTFVVAYLRLFYRGRVNKVVDV